MSATVINHLLTKINHYDKDERYMCLSDLTNELLKIPTTNKAELIGGTDRKLTAALLDRCEKDTSPDVQAMTVKCLSVYVTRVGDAHVMEMCDKLTQLLLRGDAQLRDVYAMGIRAVITEAPRTHHASTSIVSSLVRPLLECLAGNIDAGKKGSAAGGSAAAAVTVELRITVLETLCEVVKTFGATSPMEPQHGSILTAFYAGLLDANSGIRRRCITGLGVLAPFLSDGLLEQLVAQLLASLDKGSKGDARVQVQALGSVVRAVGPRLGRFTGRVVPVLLAQLGDPVAAAQDDRSNDDASNDLRETVLAALESFLGQGQAGSGSATGKICAKTGSSSSAASMSPFVPSVVPAALGWLRFDPNYSYGDDEDATDTGNDEDMDQDEEEDQDGYEDDDYGEADDDSSWRSRRAAAKLLIAIVTAAASSGLRSTTAGSPSLVAELVGSLGKALAGRFKEREETVRLEVIGASSALLASVHASQGRGAEEVDDHATGSAKGQVEVQAGTSTGSGSTAAKASGQASAASTALSTALMAWLPSLVPAVLRLLKAKGQAMVKTRTAALGLLRTLLAVLDIDIPAPQPGSSAAASALGPSLGSLVPALVACTKEKAGPHAAAQRLEACTALNALLLAFSSPRDAPALAPSMPSIASAAAAACGDEYYRTQAAGLRVIATLACVLRPADPTNPSGALSSPILPEPAFQSCVATLLTALLPKVKDTNLDSDSKDAAMWAAAAMVGHAGDAPAVAGAQAEIVRVLADRAKSETTRVLALRALAYCTCSPLRPDLGEGLAVLLPDFPGFLRSAARPVRAQSVATLSAIITAQGSRLNQQALAPLVPALTEVASPLILSDGDLQLTSLALGLAKAVATAMPKDQATVLLSSSGIPARVTALAASPLLAGSGGGSGTTAQACCSFLQACVKADLGGPMAFRSLLAGLVAEAQVAASRPGGAGGARGGAGVGSGLLMLARAIAAVMAAAPAAVLQPTLLSVLGDATGQPGGGLPDPGNQTGLVSVPGLSRLVLSEVGRMVDIGSMAPTAVQGLLTAVAPGPAAAQGEDMRTMAALALAGVVSSQPYTGLPVLLAALQQAIAALPATSEPTAAEAAAGASSSAPAASSSTPSTVGDAHGLLQALREVLGRHAQGEGSGLDITPVMALVLSQAVAGSAHEVVRALAADCAGKAAAINPQAGLAALTSAAVESNPSTAVRWAAVAAIKYAVPYTTHGPHGTELEGALRTALPSIVGPALCSPMQVGQDHSVYQAALGSVTAVAYTCPAVLVGHGDMWRPVPATRYGPAFARIFGEVEGSAGASGAPATVAPPVLHGDGYIGLLLFALLPRPDLVREVDLGPFKHRVDEATPARKAALAALDALTERAPTAMGSLLSPEANPGPGVYHGMSALLPSLLLAAVDVDMDTVMLSHSVLVRVCAAGLLPRLLPSVPAADAVADALNQPLLAMAAQGGAGAAAGGAGPEASPTPEGAAASQDSVRTSLRALDAMVRALPELLQHSRKVSELYHGAARSDNTRALFATVRAEGAAAAAAGGRQ